MSDYELYLEHHGIKGQKWGIRRFQNKDGSLTVAGARRKAKKDAKEYARAKMFYGEGAGTRRKLINATVKERSKDPTYKKEFDKALDKQDMSKHASKAKQERKIKDTTKSVKKTGKGVVNIITGHPERLGASMAVAYAGYKVAHKVGADKIIKNMAKQTVSDITKSAKVYYGRKKVEAMFRR